MTLLARSRTIASGLLTAAAGHPDACLRLHGPTDATLDHVPTAETAGDTDAPRWRIVSASAAEPLVVDEDAAEGLVAEAVYRRRAGHDDADTPIATLVRARGESDG